MKVFLAAHPHYSGEALTKAVRALGHEVHFFNHTYPPWRWRWLGVMVRRLPIFGDRYPLRMKWLVKLESWAISRAFERAEGRFRPDAIIVVKGDLIDPAALKRVRDRHGAPMGCYFGDCLCSPPAAAVAREIAPHYDVFFLPDEMEVLDSIPVSARRTARALCGVDPDQFTPVQLSGTDRERYDADVAFAGVLHPYRFGVIKRLFDMPIRLKIWGGGHS